MLGPWRAAQALHTRWRGKTLPRIAGVKYAIPQAKGDLALTFDDGPDDRFTPELLDILDRMGVVATFFLVGRRATREPSIVRRMFEEGHALGSHTWSHPDPRPASAKVLLHEYQDGRHAIEDILGEEVPLFRPPMGYVALKSVIAMRLAGVKPWLWNCDPGDWRPGVRRESIVRAVEAVSPGAVVLLHDGIELPLTDEALDRGETIAAVRQVIKVAGFQGLRFTTLPVSDAYEDNRKSQRRIR
jgi:peptidoglycan/xylan/chitin deacetylase (PgdA/CDA1 family)